MVKTFGNSDGNVVMAMVVDHVDFDGSFPKRVMKSLFKVLEQHKDDPKTNKRHHARAAGTPKLSAVYLISSWNDLGVRNSF